MLGWAFVSGLQVPGWYSLLKLSNSHIPPIQKILLTFACFSDLIRGRITVQLHDMISTVN